MTTLVNVKVKYLRPQYQNLRSWMADGNNVYIGRRGRVFIDGELFTFEGSEWGNPFTLKNTPREECIENYKLYLLDKLQDEATLNRFMLLQGKTIGCWCRTNDGNYSCHGNVIIDILNQI